MKYPGLPAGMWALFAASFRQKLTEVLGYDRAEAAQITKKAHGRYRELIAKLPDWCGIKRFQTEGNCYREKGKILVGKLSVKAERMKEQQGILSAGYTDSNAITRSDQSKVLISFTDTAQRFFHPITPVLP